MGAAVDTLELREALDKIQVKAANPDGLAKYGQIIKKCVAMTPCLNPE